MVDTAVSKAVAKACGFESLLRHQYSCGRIRLKTLKFFNTRGLLEDTYAVPGYPIFGPGPPHLSLIFIKKYVIIYM